MSDDFSIHYLSECPRCGGNVDDPFWDDLCFQCDHRRHSVAPWDALDCDLCWPDEDDWQDDDDVPVRTVLDAPTRGLL
jgi:hypothetical protein